MYKRKGNTLDFGAGLGKGAKILKADSYEPFPKKDFEPTFTETSAIPNSSYDNVVSLNVLNAVKPDVRKSFVRNMDKKPAQDAGFPSVGKTRVAVTEPDLLNVPAGRAGFALGQVDIDAPLLLNPRVPHETYPVQMVGKYLGGFEEPIPQGILFRDAYKDMEGRTYFNKAFGREVPFSEATKAYTLKTQLPGQTVDQELVDAIMQYSLLGK